MNQPATHDLTNKGHMTNTFNHVKPTEEQVKAMNELREAYKYLADRIEVLCPQGRYKSLAITELEKSAMFANKAITHE